MAFFLRNKNLKNLADEELVKLYQKKQGQDCFEEIYSRYAHLVYGTCFKYLKDTNLAQDKMMDIFMSLMHKIPKQPDIKNFNAWLYQVSRNECLGHLRKVRRLSFSTIDNELSEKLTDNFMESDAIIHLLDKGNAQLPEEIIEKAINQLKPEQQACLRAFFWDDKSYKEISEELDYPLKKVKSYIQNGKRNLGKILVSLDSLYES